MSKKKKDEKVRLHLAITPATKKKIESIGREIGAQTMTEVICRSITVYGYLCEQKKAGNKIIVIDDNKIFELVGLFL